MVMEVIYVNVNEGNIPNLEDSVSAIGFFDGLHQGHRELVNATIEKSKEIGINSSLITFSPSPASVLANVDEQLLTTIDERIIIAEQLGLNQLIVLTFNRELSQLSPDQFHSLVIKQLNIKHIVCGEDFRYGFKGSGSVETLKQVNDLGLTIINDLKDGDERVSSTLIKSAIKSGDMESVTKWLKRPYSILGTVKHGRKVGRTIGFPTVNLSYPDNKILPIDGIYVGITSIDGKNYVSTINIGHNPTVNTVDHKSVESFIHDFDEDVYNKVVTFKFIKRIRDELKFDNVDQLIAQMHKDIAITNDYFSEEVRRGYNIEVI